MKNTVLVLLLAWLMVGCKFGDLSGSHREEELYYQYIFGLEATADGGYLTGAIRYHSIATVTTTNDWLHPTYSYDPGSTYADLMLIKTDASGHRQWEKVLEKPQDQYGRKLVVLPNGHFLLAADMTNKSHTEFDILLVETGPDGRELKSRQLASPGSGMSVNDLQASVSGDIFIAGYWSKSGNTAGYVDWVARLSSDHATTRWSLVASDSTTDLAGLGTTAFDRTDDDHLIIVARRFSRLPSSYVRKISPEGVVRWSEDITAVREFLARQLYTTADGGCLMAGTAYATSAASARQIVLLKADANGKVQHVQWITTGSQGGEENKFLSKCADGNFVLVSWLPERPISLTLLDGNGSSPSTLATTSTLSPALTPYFVALADGDLLMVELGVGAKDITMRRISSEGIERWSRVITKL